MQSAAAPLPPSSTCRTARSTWARPACRWSWDRYALNRVTRLYLVLIPGLLLTLFWDTLGLDFFPANPVYTGEPRLWSHDFIPVRERLTLEAFTANAFFLQTILAPPLGSNDALWSLSYEFWYYMIFPCLWLAVNAAARGWQRPVYLLAGLGMMVFAGKIITLHLTIWGCTIAIRRRSTTTVPPWGSQWPGSFVVHSLSRLIHTSVPALRWD